MSIHDHVWKKVFYRIEDNCVTFCYYIGLWPKVWKIEETLSNCCYKYKTSILVKKKKKNYRVKLVYFRSMHIFQAYRKLAIKWFPTLVTCPRFRSWHLVFLISELDELVVVNWIPTSNIDKFLCPNHFFVLTSFLLQ